ncbi:MAG: tetratricopeptide repeat protein [Candidatus Cyclobacteriaceae bacterium M3_2C_046]
MNQKRIDQLLKYLEENPNDPFLKYGLAMEYKDHNSAKALSYLEQLLNQHPDYLPAYYHAAELYAELDQRSTAESIYQAGIALAKKQNDHHTLQELNNAYTNLMYDED